MHSSAQTKGYWQYLLLAASCLGLLAIVGATASLSFARVLDHDSVHAEAMSLTKAPLLIDTPTPCVPEWTIVPSPNHGESQNVLSATAATSNTDIWAVGSYETISATRTLVEHWDG